MSTGELILGAKKLKINGDRDSAPIPCAVLLSATVQYQRRLLAHGVQRLGAGGGRSLDRACRDDRLCRRTSFDKSLHCRLFYKRDPRWQELSATC